MLNVGNYSCKLDGAFDNKVNFYKNYELSAKNASLIFGMIFSVHNSELRLFPLASATKNLSAVLIIAQVICTRYFSVQ